MSFIESSTSMNPLRAAAGMMQDDEEQEIPEPDEGDEEEQEPPREARERTGTLKERLLAQIDDINLARYIDDATLNEIGMAVTQEFEIDDNSRANWVDITEKAMKMAMQQTQPKEFPWPGAANVIYPLLSHATIEFASRTYPALIQGRRVVKGVVYGSDKGTPVTQPGPDGQKQPKMGPPGPDGQPTPVWLVAPGEKRQRADRIGSHMSWQLLEEMPEWEPQTDGMLHQIPIVGGMARKTFRDMVEGCNASLTVSLMNLVWNYDAPSFEKAPRHTEKLLMYPYEIEDAERFGSEEDEMGEGMFLHYDYGPGDAQGADGHGFGFQRTNQESNGYQADPDAPHLFLEQHRRWDLDGDGYAEPYVVTVHQRSNKVVRIVARYDAEGVKTNKKGDKIIKIEPTQHYTLFPFFPSMDGGSYPSGWGHLLHSLGDQINTSLNQMFDAGTLQNAGGGFIGDNLSIASGQVMFRVGKFHRVNTKGGTIRDAIYMPDWKGPSAVMFQLLGFLTEAAKGMAGLQNVLAGDAAIANAPPTTVLALIEQGLKTYTAIIKRLYRGLKSEFDKLYRLNRLYLKEAQTFTVADDEQEIHPDDYRLGGGVAPVADPSMITDMQKLTRAQILGLYRQDPAVNGTEVVRRMFEAAEIERIDDLMAPPNPLMAAMGQLAMAEKQAELGRTRAAELRDHTQAFLNLALARAKSTGPEEAFIEQQLTFLRLHIEALNTSVKAAAVDHKFHQSHLNQVQEHARHLATEEPDRPAAAAAAAVEPTPGPTGPFPIPPSAPPAAQSGGVGPLAPQSSDGSLPPVPPGPGA